MSCKFSTASLKLLFLLWLFGKPAVQFAQTDTLFPSKAPQVMDYEQRQVPPPDTGVVGKAVKQPEPVHSPKKAALLSAVLPGAGQAYNRKYWKIGIIYAGAGALVYALDFNTRNYRQFKSELIYRQQNGNKKADLSLERYSNDNLNELQSYYRRNRDLTLIGFALLYAVNIIDATVDAHLFDFDISDDLSMQVRPTPIVNNMAFHAGLSIRMRF